MKQRIFVYGTLKRGGHYSHYLTGKTYLGKAYTEPCYRMVNCGTYPGLYPVEENGISIQGEVWEVDAKCRARLDVLEDVSNGEYEVAPIRLLPPFDAPDVNTYIYRLPCKGMPDAGDNWKV